jgi:hypothetical protein
MTNKIEISDTLSKASQMSMDNYIKRFQYDVVGWTQFIIDCREPLLDKLPEFCPEPSKNLPIRDRSTSLVCAPPIEKIYENKESYLQWLKEEYARDHAFYQCILERSKSANRKELGELQIEVDCNARDYLKVLEKMELSEKERILAIPDADWELISKSKYPKIELARLLGAIPEAIVANFGIYLYSTLQGEFTGSRSAFFSATGPTYWQVLEASKAELDYFRTKALKTASQRPQLRD